MERSSLYQEDVVVNGHSAIWGSFYDPSSGSWGYACCSSTKKGDACPHGIANTSADESVSGASQLPGAGESIKELIAAADGIQVGAEFVRRFVDAVLKDWHERT